MNIEFLEPATAELYEAIVFYNIQRQGLGLEFAKEVQDTIERIKQNPEAWATISTSKQARRCLTNRIPYGIIYQKGSGHFKPTIKTKRRMRVSSLSPLFLLRTRVL
jgi:hypothetical protein